MKHDFSVTLILVVFFFIAQLVGLCLLTIDANATVDEDGNIQINHDDTAIGPRPETEGVASFVFLVVGVIIGTLLILLLIKFQQFNLWKIWFFLAVWMTTTISLGVFLPTPVALGAAIVMAIVKIWRPTVIVHNVVEVLMYSGIAILVVPIFDLVWSFALLIAISIYDMYAVWKSKHMVSMAQFQTESKLFAGLMVPYTPKAKDGKSKKAKVQHKVKKAAKHIHMTMTKVPAQAKTAILGGGDIAFPLIFAGTIVESLIHGGFFKIEALIMTLPVVIGSTIALYLLFYYAKKDRFYPAMPFITAGCLVGFVVTEIVRMIAI